MLCSHWGSEHVDRETGVMSKSDLTEMERTAIVDARASLCEVLERLGLMEPFFNRSAEEIDAVIEACWRGCQASMWRQSEWGVVPF